MRYRHLPLPRRVAARLVARSWETFAAVFVLIGSLPRLAGQTAPQSVEVVFPLWLRVAWGVMLLVGAVGVLAGIVTARPRIERPALQLLAGAAFAYAAAIVGLNGPTRGGLAASIAAALAASCVMDLVRDRLLSWLVR